ncbi:transcriptional regulator [Winogradskyella sp. A3E31]|uniref:transcriptional regulator n=1 Tax=Winogradskyella sp. A3E31 TaxID=3349637 RepID=UPI00398B1233
MTLLKRVLLIALLFLSNRAQAQDQLTSEEALAKYNEIKQTIRSKKLAFTSETYWSYYFKLDGLVKQMPHNHEVVSLYYYNTGYNFRYLGLPKEAIKKYKQFFKYHDDHDYHLTAKEKEYFIHYRAHSYGYLADMYAKASYLDSANIMHQNNIKLTSNIKKLNHASALNNYGLFFYWTKKELDSALIYFNKSYELTKTILPIDHLLGSVRDNIADVYVEQGKIDEANTLYQENFEYYKTSETEAYNGIDSKRLVAAGVQLIDTSIELGELNLVETILDQMNAILDDTTGTIRLFPISKLHYLQAKERVLLAQNKTEEAYMVAKDVKHLSDSITAIDNANKNTVESTISELTFQRLKTEHLLEKQEKESKIYNQRLKLWIVSITSIAILGFIIALYMRRKQRLVNARIKQQVTELQNEKLNTEIEAKQRDLSDFAINLTQNQAWAAELADKLEQLKTTKGRERKKLFDAFEQDVQNKIRFDDNTKEFYQRLDTLSDAFYSKLQNEFPKLSKTEKRLCSLIRLKMDSHDIATLQNITVSSLNTSRYRLRKKLNLAPEEDLDEFIQGL